MENTNVTHRRLFSVCISLLLVVLVGIGGYIIGKNQAPHPIWQVTPAADLQGSGTDLISNHADGNYNQVFLYPGIADVAIKIDGKTLDLGDALQQGAITEEEICALARADARNGICEETWESHHGLTHFTYHYPDFNLRIINDIYETPDGKQHLIRNICFYHSDENIGAYVRFYDPETSYPIDREDWGIQLEIAEVSPAGLTVTYTQSGGQQIGQLDITDCSLYNPQILPESSEILIVDHPVRMNGSSEFSIDWTGTYGELPSGSYMLNLSIRDTYEESQVHPLMENYSDWQIYALPFDIP